MSPFGRTPPESNLARLIAEGRDKILAWQPGFTGRWLLVDVLAQRLVRTLCKNCKESYHPSKSEYEALVREYGSFEAFEKNVHIPYTNDLILNRPVGCNRCYNAGYAGRMCLHELLLGTDPMKKLIQSNSLIKILREQAVKDGMTTLKQDGIEKIFGGNCDLLQVRKVCIR